MDFLARGLLEALRLVATLDPDVIEITLRSLAVSGLACLVAALVGIPLGAVLALRRFRGRRLVEAVVDTAMGLPPVVVGLVVVLLLARRGPLGVLQLLYEPGAMVLAQVVLALPIVTGLTASAVSAVDPDLRVQLLALGATPLQLATAMLAEARQGVATAVVAGFGRVIAEVGAVMMVGGNIEHHTRVLTTATVLEARQGNYERAIALGLVLLALAFVVNVVMTTARSHVRRP